MTEINFKHLPKDGTKFESMVAQLLVAMGYRVLEEPSVGVDGGRDILIERTLKDFLGERRERIVVQCKHFAHSGKSVGERHLPNWHNTLVKYHAHGYLLVTDTYVTEGLNRLFAEFNAGNGERWAACWTADKLADFLNQYPSVREIFFPNQALSQNQHLWRQGWGIIFHADEAPEIKSALEPLLRLRAMQTAQQRGTFKIFEGQEGYREGEGAYDFLERNGVGPGVPDPNQVPLFLLLIGNASTIPFVFQTQLSVQYAVGRLYFDTREEYENYANSVAKIESGESLGSKHLTLFAAEPPNDPLMELASRNLIETLEEQFRKNYSDWSIRLITKNSGTKKMLRDVFEGPIRSSLLFIAGHGIGYRTDSPNKASYQGAIVTADWPGPGYGAKKSEYFSADDLSPKTNLSGSIAFIFGCYSAGNSSRDEYGDFFDWADQGPTKAQVSQLPKKLLGRSEGAPLAVIGHVGRNFGSLFAWKDLGPQTQTVQTVLETLMNGEPAGIAVQSLSRRYAELAGIWSSILEDVYLSRRVSIDEFHHIRTAMLDSRDYVLLGDPAVRLALK